MIFDSKRLENWQDGQSPPSNYTVLVVDDEPSNLKVMSSPLSRKYNVLEANSAEQALDVIAEHPDICLVISDQRMPGRSGVELLQACRESIPDAVGVIVTGYVDIDAVIQAINHAGIYKFILKPIDMHDLMLTAKRGIQEFEDRRQRDQTIAYLKDELDARDRAIQEQQAAWKNESLVDSATGLLNRRFMTRNLDREQALVVRLFARQAANDQLQGSGSMQFLLVDLAEHAKVCERFGEQAGEVLMEKVATLLARIIRPWDFLARWSESTFLIVARDTTAAEAQSLACKTRGAVESLELVFYGESVPVRQFAMGYACFPLCATMPSTFRWSDVIELAATCLAAANLDADGTWVGLSPTDQPVDLTLEGAGGLSAQSMAERGMLTLNSSIENVEDIRWSD